MTLHEQEVPHDSYYYHALLEAVPEGIEVRTACLSVSSDLLYDINERYGPNGSEKELKYHNAAHSLDTARRCLKLLKAIDDAVPGLLQPIDYELGMLGACGHDFFQGFGSGVNERSSAAHVVGLMMENGYGSGDSIRVHDAIMVTQVERGENGEITQYLLRTGKPDVINFALAMADINGIAMEGFLRMIDDGTNWYAELYDDPKLSDAGAYCKFLAIQYSFLQERLGAVNGDVTYYFDENDRDTVMAVMQEVFAPSKNALLLAQWLDDPLHLEKIEHIVRKNKDRGLVAIADAHRLAHKIVSWLTSHSQN